MSEPRTRTKYHYDAASNRKDFIDPENGTTTYGFDLLNRLQTVTPPAAFGSGSFVFGYDDVSRRTSLTRPNAVNTTYSYKPLTPWLESVLHQLGASTVDGASYTVDAAGNRTSKTDQRTGVTSNYTPDDIYQLKNVTQGATTTETYTYDPVGNRLSSLGVAPYVYNETNELKSTSNATYNYDNNGNLTDKTVGTDVTHYTWDFENRLTSVTLPGSGGTVSFKYDPWGRRIYKSSSSATSVYAYDGNDLIEETNASGAAVARYTQGLNVDEPLAMLRSGATSYYQADSLGTVTSLTNTAGALAQTYTFDSFGKQTASSGTLTNPFQYTGRELDPETNLYYYRARYYDPAVGRFVSEDPIRWFSGTADFYVYVQNDPADLVDPLGLRAAKSATADCIANGLDALFPGVTASVGAPTKEVGGHWNFPVQLRFPSYCAANKFYSAYSGSAAGGWPPPARFGSGPALHLEDLGSWSVSGGVYTIGGTAHIDLYNPNGSSSGGGGAGGLAGHIGVDVIVGHLAQLLRSNIDPAHCPWGKGCEQGQDQGPCSNSPSLR